MRLGEVLIHRGVITDKQLKRALDAQLIFGAHLGTCLIELGYIDEISLGNLLSEILGVKYADRKLLADIPPNVTRIITAPVAEKHRAVPFELSGKKLRVAMVDPKSLSSLDDLAFVSGYRIEAWVAPEVRIMQAIERYYDVPRRLRYITLANHLDGQAERIPVGLAAVQTRAEVAVGRETSSVLSQIADAPGPARESAADSLAHASDELCRADDSARVARIILDQAARGMFRSILFSVRGGEASVWDTQGFQLTPARANRALFQLTTEPVFGLLFGETSYRGAIPADNRFDAFYEILGLERPGEALILTVHLHDRLVAILYGDGGPGGIIKGETEDYRRLGSKLALAIELLMIKRKIRSA